MIWRFQNFNPHIDTRDIELVIINNMRWSEISANFKIIIIIISLFEQIFIQNEG